MQCEGVFEEIGEQIKTKVANDNGKKAAVDFSEQAEELLRRALAAEGLQCKQQFNPDSDGIALGVRTLHDTTPLFKVQVDKKRVQIRASHGRTMTTKFTPLFRRASYSWPSRLNQQLRQAIALATSSLN